ncbi:MAG: autorepressor SdpR family transcription factor [Clostridiales bacterium]|nr:autorepressor SdpR family transcription factor [Clostridiales bacterium]
MKDDFFQALANPYRREIIHLLRWKNLSAGEIAEQFDISQPSVSRHLDVLKRAEIVTATRKANQIIYSLNLSVMEELYVELSGLLGKVPEEGGNACETE